MTEPLSFRSDLDAGRCDHPDCEECGPLYLHSCCHPEAPTWATYYQGELEISCSVCEETIIRVAVAG